MICKSLGFSVYDVRFDGDAYVMSFSGYGLIPCMDWLSLYGAIVRGGSSN